MFRLVFSLYWSLYGDLGHEIYLELIELIYIRCQGFPISNLVSENSLFRLWRIQLRGTQFTCLYSGQKYCSHDKNHSQYASN